MSETELETLTRERNLYKGKYRALLKLISRTRSKLVQITDHIEDEGDRRYFGSTNHADDLSDLYHEMMDWIWDAMDKTNRMKSDPYADIRKLRARAKEAEAEVDRLKSELGAAAGVMQSIIVDCQGASVCGEPEMGLEAIYHKASDAVSALAEVA
jgi:hypothetical protein